MLLPQDRIQTFLERPSDHYHRQILGALEAGDGERAEIIMREHVYEGRDLVIRALKEEMK